MTGRLYPPGVRFLFADLSGWRGDPRFLIPLLAGAAQGLQYRRVRPGGHLERPSLPITWSVIVDDRAPGASGPGSFDPVTLIGLSRRDPRVASDRYDSDVLLFVGLITS